MIKFHMVYNQLAESKLLHELTEPFTIKDIHPLTSFHKIFRSKTKIPSKK